MSSILNDIQDLGLSEESELELTRKKEEVDFKFVTFTLAGRYYAIDIMKVKEICKASRFTYVPNTAAFVEGVYNLRGEIITIINLRTMFHLPLLERKEDELNNVLILNIAGVMIGVIVDSIEHVLGISAKAIQPRHPLFTDIQMKYISGVIDYEGKLYIILDVDRIFGEQSEEQPEEEAPQPILKTVAVKKDIPSPKEEKGKSQPSSTETAKSPELDFQFISETLATFAHFYVDEVNAAWVKERLAEWKKIRAKQQKDFQLLNAEDAHDFLASFYSPYTGSLWGEELKVALASLLSNIEPTALKVWNPGCGKGTETYSICSILKLLYPQARLKVWASDNNLLDISNAPQLVFSEDMIPAYLKASGFIRPAGAGFQFSNEIKDLILFEYHDLNNFTTMPELDLIVARDVLSFFPTPQKEKLLLDFAEKLKIGGFLIIGNNERIGVKEFRLINSEALVAYQKEKG